MKCLILILLLLPIKGFNQSLIFNNKDGVYPKIDGMQVFISNHKKFVNNNISYFGGKLLSNNDSICGYWSLSNNKIFFISEEFIANNCFDPVVFYDFALPEHSTEKMVVNCYNYNDYSFLPYTTYVGCDKFIDTGRDTLISFTHTTIIDGPVPQYYSDDSNFTLTRRYFTFSTNKGFIEFYTEKEPNSKKYFNYSPYDYFKLNK